MPTSSPLSRAVLHDGPALQYLRTLDGVVLEVSPHCRRFFGCGPARIIGRNFGELIRAGKSDREGWTVALQAGRNALPATPFVVELTPGDQPQPMWVEVHESPWIDQSAQPPVRLIVGILVDISTRRQREAQLVDGQRLENLGLLAVGIAHDLNNILAPILIAGSILRPAAANAGQERVLDTLQTSAERGARIVRQILNFAHGQDVDRGPLNLRQIMQEVLLVVKATFPRSVTIKSQIADPLHPIRASSTQMHQLLLNLCVNARDAMPGGGTLTLTAANILLDAPPPHPVAVSTARDWVRLELTDNGTGIPADQIERIWEPFFTTKSNGMGTGLGLSTVRSLVVAHGGTIEVTSQPGAGTTFTLCFPAIDLPARTEPPFEIEGDLPTGNGRGILVVDDEPAVREMIRDTLEASDFRVFLAADGVEALTTLNLVQQEVALVITDIRMPHMAGDLLINLIKRLHPSLPVLAISGDPTVEELWDAAHQTPPDAILPKPFRGPTLVRVVAELLAATATRDA